jgi:hypothetical protein
MLTEDDNTEFRADLDFHPMLRGAYSPSLYAGVDTGSVPQSVGLPKSTGARHKTPSLKPKVADVSKRLDGLQLDMERRIREVETGLQAHRMASPLISGNNAAKRTGHAAVNPLTNTCLSSLDLHEMPDLVEAVGADMVGLPFTAGRPNNDREAFYRQMVQDTVKQAYGKLKLKSGLDLESQELVKNIVYWPHAFTSELAHLIKQRKANNISMEAFLFGTVNILSLDDLDVSRKEKNARLRLLKHLAQVALTKGWPAARQLHNCVLQGIEVGTFNWESSFDHMFQLMPTGGVEAEEKKVEDKVVNIICRSYNADAECVFSKDGRECAKVHVCLACAKRGFCFKHPEHQCRRK